VAFLEKYIVENNIDTIVTSGPPHSLHLIGLELKQKLDLKWFADFRDPWTTIGYHKPYDCLIMRIKAQSTGASGFEYSGYHYRTK
jgi:hypothetical protein